MGGSSPSTPAPLPPPAEDLGGTKKTSTTALQDKRRKGAAPLIIGGLGAAPGSLSTAFKSLLGQ